MLQEGSKILMSLSTTLHTCQHQNKDILSIPHDHASNSVYNPILLLTIYIQCFASQLSRIDTAGDVTLSSL